MCGFLFLVAVGCFSGPVTGLLGRADLCEVGFFSRASNLLVLRGCLFFSAKMDFFRACHWAFREVFFVELQTCLFVAFVFW